MNKITEENILKWTSALRSGLYQQTRNRLQDENGYCCLGVACKIFISQEKQLLENDRIIGSLPFHQPATPQWIRAVEAIVVSRLGITLGGLNDSGKSFEEIADILESLFIYNVKTL